MIVDDQNRAAALHEAAHGVAAAAVGYPVREIWIDREGCGYMLTEIAEDSAEALAEADDEAERIVREQWAKIEVVAAELRLDVKRRAATR